jgi:hypothetical protein
MWICKILIINKIKYGEDGEYKTDGVRFVSASTDSYTCETSHFTPFAAKEGKPLEKDVTPLNTSPNTNSNISTATAYLINITLVLAVALL